MSEELKKRPVRDFFKNKYFKFAFWAVVFILFVLWIGSWWLLLLLPVIYDFYVSQKVNWTFWKKRNATKKSKLVEWIDAIVFAVIAATIIRMFIIEAYMIPTSSMEGNLLVGDYLFVSKYSYGPRMPITPLSIPFTHHTMPGTTNKQPFSTAIESPYKRLAGLAEIKRNDIVVFNFPTGDTVCVEQQNPDYYQIVRMQALQMKLDDKKNGRPLQTDASYYATGRKFVRSRYTIAERPIDKQENYVKRCIGTPGDTLQVIHGNVFINGKPEEMKDDVQYEYRVYTNKRINKENLRKLGLSQEDIHIQSDETLYNLVMNLEELEKVRAFKSVDSIVRTESETDQYSVSEIFPYSEHYEWNKDNYGPIWMPKAGVTIKLDTKNIAFYHRIIESYEKNKLVIKDGKIFINDKETDTYTFKMNYYFMMGDNRHSSADSRYWGYVPEDHIVGTPLMIWMAIDQDPEVGLFDGAIRFDRILKILR